MTDVPHASLDTIDVIIIGSVILMVMVVGVIASLQANGMGIAFLEGCAPWLVPGPSYDYDDKVGGGSAFDASSYDPNNYNSQHQLHPSSANGRPAAHNSFLSVIRRGSSTSDQSASELSDSSSVFGSPPPARRQITRKPSSSLVPRPSDPAAPLVANGAVVPSSSKSVGSQSATSNRMSRRKGGRHSRATSFATGSQYTTEDSSMFSSEDEYTLRTEYLTNYWAYHNHATNFFLADKQMTFWFVGSSLFASNIGSEHFVGQAGDGARRGLAVAMFEWYAGILLILLGWVFAPIYRRLGIYTTPEFMEYRFGRWSRHYVSFITCIMYVVTKMSASIYGGAVVLQKTLQWDIYWAAGVCIVLSTIYTITGGLRAVMYTDLLQTIIFVLGGFIVLGVSLNSVGGMSGLENELIQQNKSDFWHLFKPHSDPEYPWTGMFFGQPFTSLWYWCMDQDLVQRGLAAKDDVQCKAGCVSASVLKLLPPFIMVVPGIVAMVKFPNELQGSNADNAYPVLLSKLMPPGVKGIMIASIMTAMMSSLDSVFNAGSTIITNDVYRVLYPEASADTLVYVGRTSTIGFALLSFAWIPVLQSGEGLFKTVSEIQGYLTPPIGVILLLGVTWRRANGAGALVGLLTRGIMGISRLVVNVIMKQDISKLEGIAYLFFNMAFLHFSILAWVTSALVCIVVSLMTPAPGEQVEMFIVNWKEAITGNIDFDRYPVWVTHVVRGSAVGVLLTTFTIWGIFA